MAAFREHITFSGLLGLGYGVASVSAFGFSPVQGALAGWLTALGGMLPDLDLDDGRPGRELFSVVAALAPMFLVQHVLRWLGLPLESDTILLTMVVLYLAVRFGAAELVSRLSVHRGMFHSIPAMLIAAEIVYLGYPGKTLSAKLLMAGGVAVGFLSHLVLDEVYSVELSGLKPRLKKSAGSALKIAGPEFLPNVFTFALCGTLSYVMLADLGVLEKPGVRRAMASRREAQVADFEVRPATSPDPRRPGPAASRPEDDRRLESAEAESPFVR